MDITGPLMDPGFVAAVQQFSQPLTAVISQGVFLDSAPWYFILICLVTYGLHPRHGTRIAMLFSLNTALNEAAKLFFHLPRPYWVSAAVHASGSHGSFGFPSGAAESGVVMYGYIAVVVRRFRVVILCVLLFLAAAAARLFAGIHFPLDLLGGAVIGLLLLAAFLFAAPKAEAYARTLSRPARLALIVLIAAAPLLPVYLALFSIGGWQVPDAWLALARQQTGGTISPARIQYVWSAAGFILGSLTGYEFLRSRGGWKPPAGRMRRAGVAFAGTASVLLLGGVLPGIVALAGIAAFSPELAQLISMAAIAFWLIGGVPCIAGRAGYGQRDVP